MRASVFVWNEFDRWLDPEERVLIFVPSSDAANYLFRVRAFNDTGAGAYSQAVSLNTMRRRSAR